MQTIKMVSGVQPFFDSATAEENTVIVAQNGTGSVYTYKVYGTAGQTAEIRGGFAGDEWEDMQHIATLTVDAADPIVAPRSTTRIHAWPMLAVSGTARLKIARSA